MMLGVAAVYRVTEKSEYLEYIRAWIDHHMDEGYMMESSDSCAPSSLALFLLRETGDEKYQAVMDDAFDYLYHRALRTKEGGLESSRHLGCPRRDVVGRFAVHVRKRVDRLGRVLRRRRSPGRIRLPIQRIYRFAARGIGILQALDLFFVRADGRRVLGTWQRLGYGSRVRSSSGTLQPWRNGSFDARRPRQASNSFSTIPGSGNRTVAHHHEPTGRR